MTISPAKVYDCAICHHSNHVKRTHCQTCGTIPAQYSVLGKPSVLNGYNQFVEVVNARGVSRIEDRRGRKLYLRTVPADYFA